MSRWHYSIMGTRQGPVSDRELRELTRSGKLRPNDLIWCKGMATWRAASTITGLFPEPEEVPPPLPEDDTPTLPRRTNNRLRTEEDDDDSPLVIWEAWQIWLFTIITLGLFSFYIIPSWSKQLEWITGKTRMPFWMILLLGIFTLGIALTVIQIVYAFELEKHSQREKMVYGTRLLGGWVLTMQLVSYVMGLTCYLILPGILISVWSIWLVQKEINLYAVLADYEDQVE